MSYIRTVAPGEATGLLHEMYAADLESSGYVANYTQVMSLRPEVITAWRQLSGAIRKHMDFRLYELATFAAARALRSSY